MALAMWLAGEWPSWTPPALATPSAELWRWRWASERTWRPRSPSPMLPRRWPARREARSRRCHAEATSSDSWGVELPSRDRSTCDAIGQRSNVERLAGGRHGAPDQVAEGEAMRVRHLVRSRRREPVDPSRPRARRAAVAHGDGRLRP